MKQVAIVLADSKVRMRLSEQWALLKWRSWHFPEPLKGNAAGFYVPRPYNAHLTFPYLPLNVLGCAAPLTWEGTDRKSVV